MQRQFGHKFITANLLASGFNTLPIDANVKQNHYQWTHNYFSGRNLGKEEKAIIAFSGLKVLNIMQ
jgi:hypothetical protein